MKFFIKLISVLLFAFMVNSTPDPDQNLEENIFCNALSEEIPDHLKDVFAQLIEWQNTNSQLEEKNDQANNMIRGTMRRGQGMIACAFGISLIGFAHIISPICEGPLCSGFYYCAPWLISGGCSLLAAYHFYLASSLSKTADENTEITESSRRELLEKIKGPEAEALLRYMEKKISSK